MNDALSRSRQLYRKGNNDLALEILDSYMQGKRVIVPLNASQDDLSLAFSLYDLRAVLYEKQGFLQKAKSDAQVMIKLLPTDPRGYLRLGRIYHMLGRPRDAVLVYTRALKNVAPDHKSRAMIEKSLHQTKVLAPEMSLKRVDPVAHLPPELLYEIFTAAQLSIRDLVQLLSVSRSWYLYIVSETRFWSNIVIQPKAKYLFRPETILAYCAMAGQTLHIDISEATFITPNRFMQKLAEKHRSQLKSMITAKPPVSVAPPLFSTFRGAQARFQNLQSVSMSSDATDKDLSWALANLPNLESIELKEIDRAEPPSLEVLPQVASSRLHTVKVVGRTSIIVLLNSFAQQVAAIPSLEVLELHRVVQDLGLTQGAAENSNLKTFGFTSSKLNEPGTTLLPPLFKGNIESLTLNCVRMNVNPRNSIRPLPLKYLEIKWSHLVLSTLGDLLNYFKCHDTLETLVIDQTNYDLPVEIPSGMFPNLKTLQFTRMPILDDLTLKWILDTMPALKYVNFDDSNVTGTAITKFVLHGITHLRCRNCPLSFETTKWLQEQDVKLV